MILFFFISIASPQSSNHQFLRFGVQGGIGVIEPHDLNSLLKRWLDYQRIEYDTQEDLWKRPGIDGSCYIGLMPLSFIEIRPEVGYFISPKEMTVMIDNNDLSILMQWWKAGVGLNLAAGPFQIGAGYFKFFSEIGWDDEVLNYSDIWRGETFGYEYNLGLNKMFTTHFGIDAIIIYRNALIEEMHNKDGFILHYLSSGRKFELDLTGYAIRCGLFLTF